VPDVSAGSNPAYERLHFAHVHGFTAGTLQRAADAAGLVADERFTRRAATIVFRKRRPDEAPYSEASAAATIYASLKRASPLAYILGFGFLGPMLRRNAKALADNFRRAPT
jgi:hypothetical protein